MKFAKYEAAQTLQNEGTLSAFLGPKGSFSITPNSIKGSVKENGETTRVFLILDKGDGSGETAILNCSQAVSEGIRAKKIGVRDLLHYEIVTTEMNGNEVSFLSAPAAEGNVLTVKVAEAKKAPAPVKVDWNEYVTL